MIETVTEPEWDDEQRSGMLALGRYEAKVCDCGYHESFARDPANHFTFEIETCPVCKGGAQFGRVLESQDEQARKAMGENPPPASPRPSDGRRVMTRLMMPDELEARRSTSGPARG